MSKAIKTILIILVSLAVVFASIFIFGKLLGAELRFHSENYEVVKETSYDIDNIDILNLQFKSADVNIKLSYDDQIKITEYSNKKNKVFTEKLTKETISVIDDNDSFCIGACLKSSTYYDISLPMDYKGDLKVETTSGNIFIIDTINVGSIDLSSNSGDIKITSNIY